MTYEALAPGIEGEAFEQFSPLLHTSYPSYRIRTSAGNECGVIFFRRFSYSNTGGWCIDQREIGDRFIGPASYPTPREAALAAIGRAIKLQQ